MKSIWLILFIANIGISVPVYSYADSKTAFILINGGTRPYEMASWNSVSDFYTTLVQHYNYPKKDILVLSSYGISDRRRDKIEDWTSFPDIRNPNLNPSDLDGDGNPEIDYPAQKKFIELALKKAAEIVGANGQIFIFIAGHGNKGKMMLWRESLTGDEFSNLVKKYIPDSVKKAVLVGNCYAAGIGDQLVGSNAIIGSGSTTKQPSSYAFSHDAHQLEINYLFTQALKKTDRISFSEAFTFASDNLIGQNVLRYGLFPNWIHKPTPVIKGTCNFILEHQIRAR